MALPESKTFLDTYAGVGKKKPDNVFALGELKKFEKLGYGLTEVKDYLTANPDVKLAPNAVGYFNTFVPKVPAKVDTPTPPTQTVTYTNPVTGETGLSLPEMEGSVKIALGNLAKDTALAVENARGEWGYKTQGLASSAARDVGFRQAQASENVAGIEARGRIDLQGIVNAGMNSVKQIEKETAENVQRIGGEFAVKGEETRQSGQRDIARIGSRAAILQGLVGAFNF
jgi:hypothetical protein